MSGPLAVVLFVVGVVVAIMIHEWGHYATARRFGMRVDRFFLGFGPTLWSTHRGETEYGVKALPLGGFVRILGMSEDDRRRPPVGEQVFDREAVARDRELSGDPLTAPAVPEHTWRRLDEVLEERGTPARLRERILRLTRGSLDDDATPAEAATALRQVVEGEVPDTRRPGDLRHRIVRGDEGRFFGDRPAWQRAIVLASGSFLHFVQAIVLLFAVNWLFGPPSALPVVEAVAEDSPAAEAGLRPDDRIIAVDGVEVQEFEPLREAIQSRLGRPTEFTIERDSEVLTVRATPAEAVDADGDRVLVDGEPVGQLGFQPVVANVRLPADEAFVNTFVGDESFPALVGQTFLTLGDVFGPEGIGAIFQEVSESDGERDASGAISLVGAGQLAAEGAGEVGVLLVVTTLLVSINVFIGVFNILPLPPLDGGHLAVLGVERAVNGVRRVAGREPTFSIDARAVAAIAVPVLVLLATVSVALLWLDVTNPVQLR